MGGIFDASTGASISAAPLFNDTTGAALGAPSYFGTASAASIASNASLSNAGVIGGGQIGYNWQFNNSFLAGLEADIQGTTLSSNASASGAATEPSTGSLVSTTANLTKSLSYLGTVRGRLGFLVTPTLLVFGSGGLAYGGMNFTAGLFQNIVQPEFPVQRGFGRLQRRAHRLDGGRRRRMDVPRPTGAPRSNIFITTSARPAPPMCFRPPFPLATCFTAPIYQTSTHFNGQVVRVGVNYHFQWFSPATVVAKY